MTTLKVSHKTVFTYDRLVRSSYNEVRMTPRPTDHQRIVASDLAISPMTSIFEYDDYWGTRVHSFETLEPHQVLSVVATSTVEMLGGTTREPGFITWEDLRRRHGEWMVAEFLAETSACQAPADLASAAADLARSAADPHAAALAICGFVHDNVTYLPGTTNVTTTAQQAWELRAGVCQDISQICIAALRSVGIPTKYISGYIGGRSKLAVDETVVGESHAWIEWLTDRWFAFDPTNMKHAHSDHIAVARGRQYSDVTPLRGVFEGHAAADLKVSVEVTRLD
ncbi:MAG: transglutaminase family protein [Coriobacteriales bacterium]|jgi:transglutaminase-like putative cysteine protease|nr:transglutaminase family protein [Coriobacteriales bacterium]